MGEHNTNQAAAAQFIARWTGKTASELSTAQSFVNELCALLGVAPPTHELDYMFERPITFSHGDGSTSAGRIDCYLRGHFVLEAKKVKAGPATKGFDDALLRARAQAEGYARALPAAEGRPPFVLVVDVGNVIELYSEFSRSGATYTPFPDPRSHRIKLADLAKPEVQATLRSIWTEPLSLDPSRISARVTRKVAAELADLAKSLEAIGHAPQAVAAFLTRCLFSMFAEDVGLLPQANPTTGAESQGSFVHLLRQYREQPATLEQMLKVFWQAMDAGGFNAAIAQNVLRFNGKLFKGAGTDGYVLPLSTTQIDGLLRAASANWQEVEPAIFGTLLERALDPTERHALGAHYTPRAYVERLVLPTVVEPLRADWANAQAAAMVLAREADELDGKKRDAKLEEARAELRRFHHYLCTIRVLDPACGSGNFLYVTLEHLKRLEGEVMNQLEALGEKQDRLGLEGETVTLQQLRGIELNQRAAALAELVLWIGWLQWHVRTRGLASVAEPVVHDYGNIENRDAVLAYDRAEPALDADGKAITRWDGITFKKHPVTGEDIPEEAAQVVQWAYVNPQMAQWPEAEFIVGNPPYLGARTSRAALGDGYLQALRSVHPDVPENADFVMYWWDMAATRVAKGVTRSFGLITTNSLRQSFNRAVLARHLGSSCSLTFAIPDHPWVDSSGDAAIRVALSAAQRSVVAGILETVEEERPGIDGEVEVELQRREGLITPGLTIGVDVAACPPLRANSALCSVGYQLTGKGFVVSFEQAKNLDPKFDSSAGKIRRLISGRDLTQTPRSLYAIDLFGLDEQALRTDFPVLYQWVFDRVRPEREQNQDSASNSRWWVFARPRAEFRPALEECELVCATSLTAKHRTFVRVESDDVCDSTTVIFALGSGIGFGTISSYIHVAWALASGGRLGVGNDARYNKSVCFEPFPFPSEDTGLTPALTDRIRLLAEQLDSHRKARQAAFDTVTLTGIYNVLDKLRCGEPLNAKDKALHEQGLVSVLQSLHDELDAAVLAAYGWSDLGAVPWADEAARAAWTETLLTRLVALNAKRAAEEAAGTVRWLRPEFQDPALRKAQAVSETGSLSNQELLAHTSPGLQTDLAMEFPLPTDKGRKGKKATTSASDTGPDALATASGNAQAWPATLPDQVRAVAAVLAANPAAMPQAAIEARFKGRGPWKKSLPRILETLEAMGRAKREDEMWRGQV